MTDQDEFVTVLTSADTQHVRTVIAALQSEGIACEHPGLNHAQVVPGLPAIQVHLRVPESRREEALALIGELRREEGSAGGTTFRVVRTRGRQYAAFGFIIAFFTTMTLFARRVPLDGPLPIVIYAVYIGGGYLLGRFSRTDYCSRPDCGGALARDAKECPKCKSVVRGELKKPSEHFAALETWERSQNTPQSD